jgi:NhaP-type Na+/H+ or K+/H+ antiporter
MWFLLQLFYLSGILSVFFCGIVMSHYTWHNVTENSRTTTKYVVSYLYACFVARFRQFGLSSQCMLIRFE